MLNGFGDAERNRRAECDELGAVHDGADLSDPARDRAMIARCTAELGAPDILVNNAGIQHVAPVDRVPARKMGRDHRDQSDAPHSTPSAWRCRRCATRAGAGSSTPPRRTAWSPRPTSRPMSPPSTASPGLTKTVALEAARDGVTVNCISPGYVWTTLVESQIPDTMKARGLTREQVINDVLLAAQPTKRFVTPEEVAALALFLCRDEARVDHRRQPQHGRRLDGGSSVGRDVPPAYPRRRLLALPACTMMRPAGGVITDPSRDWRRSPRPPTATGCATGARRSSRASARRALPATRPRSPAKARCSTPTPRSAAARSPTAATLPGDQARRQVATGCSITSPTPRSLAASAPGSGLQGWPS